MKKVFIIILIIIFIPLIIVGLLVHFVFCFFMKKQINMPVIKKIVPKTLYNNPQVMSVNSVPADDILENKIKLYFDEIFEKRTNIKLANLNSKDKKEYEEFKFDICEKVYASASNLKFLNDNNLEKMIILESNLLVESYPIFSKLFSKKVNVEPNFIIIETVNKNKIIDIKKRLLEQEKFLEEEFVKDVKGKSYIDESMHVEEFEIIDDNIYNVKDNNSSLLNDFTADKITNTIKFSSQSDIVCETEVAHDDTILFSNDVSTDINNNDIINLIDDRLEDNIVYTETLDANINDDLFIMYDNSSDVLEVASNLGKENSECIDVVIKENVFKDNEKLDNVFDVNNFVSNIKCSYEYLCENFNYNILLANIEDKSYDNLLLSIEKLLIDIDEFKTFSSLDTNNLKVLYEYKNNLLLLHENVLNKHQFEVVEYKNTLESNVSSNDKNTFNNFINEHKESDKNNFLNSDDKFKKEFLIDNLNSILKIQNNNFFSFFSNRFIKSYSKSVVINNKIRYCDSIIRNENLEIFKNDLPSNYIDILNSNSVVNDENILLINEIYNNSIVCYPELKFDLRYRFYIKSIKSSLKVKKKKLQKQLKIYNFSLIKSNVLSRKKKQSTYFK